MADRDYDKHNFLIHDYFFAKTLDKVRPGGVVAFVTSKGTMDKLNENVRKYLAEHAELLGAVRLPNTAFKANAGTKVTSDIIFLQKRDRMVKEIPDWVHTSEDEKGIRMNSYFAEHPEKKPVLATKLIEMLHFSGCPNSCTAHEVSRFGFQGCRKNLDGVLTDCFQLWRNPEFPASAIGGAADEVIPAAKIGERVIQLLEEEHLLD